MIDIVCCTERYCLLHIALLRCTQMLEALRQSRLLHLNERVRAELAERTSLQQVGPGACNTSVQHAAHPRACARMCVRACVRALQATRCVPLFARRPFASPRCGTTTLHVATSVGLCAARRRRSATSRKRRYASGRASCCAQTTSSSGSARQLARANQRAAAACDTRRAACIAQHSMRRARARAPPRAERYAPVWVRAHVAARMGRGLFVACPLYAAIVLLHVAQGTLNVARCSAARCVLHVARCAAACRHVSRASGAQHR
jgi:hypothetical protein